MCYRIPDREFDRTGPKESEDKIHRKKIIGVTS